MAPKVEVYTWRSCPYCIRAKELLRSKGVEFIEYSIDGDTQMQRRANGRRSVPQTFINDQHIGGCDDLYDLDDQGKLAQLLAATKGV